MTHPGVRDVTGAFDFLVTSIDEINHVNSVRDRFSRLDLSADV